jgi:CheY-like chemotaxis protein
VPIVAMTAQALPAQIEACRGAGMNDHLAKPIAGDALQSMIARWAGQPPSRAPVAAIADRMTDLQRRFVQRSRDDRARLGSLLDASRDGAVDDLRAIVHRFAGTAGTFGFDAVGKSALALDQTFADGHCPVRDAYLPLLQALDDMLQAA